MVEVDFQEENNWNPERVNLEETSTGMAGFLLRKGIVKNKKQANYVLFVLSGVFFLLMLYFVFRTL